MVGLLFLILGLLAIVVPLVTGASLALVVGAALVVLGVVQLWRAFSTEGRTEFLRDAAVGVLYAGVGVIFLVDPAVVGTTLTVLLVGFLLVDGVLELAFGFRLRPEPNWEWLVASGVVSLLAAGLVWVGWPSNATVTVAVLFGLALLSSGVATVLVGRERKRVPEVGSTSAGTGGS